MTGTRGDLKTGRSTRWVLVAVMAASWVAGCRERPPAPAAKRSSSAPEEGPTSCRFTLDQQTVTTRICRFQFLPPNPKKDRAKAFLQVSNFAISADTYPSLQLIAHVVASSPDGLANQTVGAKAVVLKSATADPLASKQDVEVTITRARAPYIEGTFKGTVQASGSKKAITISGKFRARSL